jgi:6,7-dimethyl-8-ribityllumazine synthase
MAEAPHIMIVEARFYQDIAAELFRGAEAELKAAEATYERVTVPGTFEVPAAIRIALRSLDFYAGRPRYDGFIALGCVIRGETSHYDHVCTETTRKLQDLACEFTLALGYGILTCDTREQAWARASVEDKNRGADAARACLEMVHLKRRFHLFPR